MGWTEKQAIFFKNGKVDRKTECDELFVGSGNRHPKVEILKSTMVGTVYYAAIQLLDKWEPNEKQRIPNEEKEVIGCVVMTSTRKEGNMFWFGYKIVEETCGPYHYDCPISILKLLTPTTSEWANQWREKCRQKHEFAKMIRTAPIGAMIGFPRPSWVIADDPHLSYSEKITLTKVDQYGKIFWTDGFYRWKTAQIPMDAVRV